MNMEDVIAVATVREEIRGGALRVDAADIPRHVELAQAEKPKRPVVKDVYWNRQKSDSPIASAVDLNVKEEIVKTMGVSSPSEPQYGDMKEGNTDKSDVERSVSLLPSCP